jgi:lipoprotein-releasing system permease protein
MLIAGFGIYNILNMTVSQKINDIAILKAIGFKGNDVIRIFVTQALSIGLIGVVGGMLMALLMITLLKKVYIGGDIGYFPVDYELQKFIQGVVMGLVITFFAGYIPARKAAKVDPVSIFRK